MKIFKKIAIIVLIALLAVTITTISRASTVTVTTETLKIRKGPSTDTVILGLLSIGNKVEYIAEEGDWYKIKSGEITGYISKEFSKWEEGVNNIQNTQVNNVQTSNTQTNNTQINNTQTNEIITNTITSNQEQQSTEGLLGDQKLNIDTKAYILPLINADILETLTKGQEVTVISVVNNWAYIQTEKIDAWVIKDSIKTSTTPVAPETKPETKPEETTPEETIYETSKVMYVNEPSIYVRSGPGTTNKVVDSLTLNLSVTVMGESGEWYKIKLADTTGYVAKRLVSDKKAESTSRGTEVERTEKEEVVKVQETSSKGQQIVDYAKEYLGCKYVYGGSGPNTFDCSGFTMYVYKNFGINLTHSATAQSKVGTYVAKEDLQPGDLVFFTDYETGNGIGHCGIYIGNGDFIQASSGTGYCVKISTLLSGSYYNRYETARRIL